MHTHYFSTQKSREAEQDEKIIFAPTIVSETAIRFEEKKEKFFWAQPGEINFVLSADHYVKALIGIGKQKKWMSRHCTIKDLLNLLPASDFIRLNKFYLLNRHHFTGINESEKKLFIDETFSISVPHCISKYVLDSLRK